LSRFLRKKRISPSFAHQLFGKEKERETDRNLQRDILHKERKKEDKREKTVRETY